MPDILITEWERKQIENLRRLHGLGLTDSDLEFCDEDIRFMLRLRKLRDCGERMAFIHLDSANPAIRKIGKRESV